MKNYITHFKNGLIIAASTALLFLGMLWLRERFLEKKSTEEGKLSYKYIETRLKDVPQVWPHKNGPYLAASTNYEHLYYRADKSLIYDVNYTLDGAGYRNPVTGITDKKNASHLLLVGCSQIFGLGIDYQDTLGARLSPKLPQHAVYNLGIPGAGPHDHLHLFQNYPLEKYVTQPLGTMIYFYYFDHLSRATMAPDYLNWAEPKRPAYGLDKEGKAVYLGPLEEQEAWKKVRLIKKAGLERSHLEVSRAKNEEESQIKLMVALIRELKQTYLKTFPKGKFYFVVFPHNNDFNPVTQKIMQELIKVGITVAPYEEMAKKFAVELSPGEVNPYIVDKEDQHPNGKANEMLAEILKDWLLSR